ncbi:hypothetical protein RRG08_026489 [Elysia crispata]|uniref:Uncharacterized protein n=1 Tax=Elysia crispata TaxID=231223 RepID=A0AAE1CS47_9GAST|nr:hypothetical protein RRG08_026489 [Elysia crispata]
MLCFISSIAYQDHGDRLIGAASPVASPPDVTGHTRSGNGLSDQALNVNFLAVCPVYRLDIYWCRSSAATLIFGEISQLTRPHLSCQISQQVTV